MDKAIYAMLFLCLLGYGCLEDVVKTPCNTTVECSSTQVCEEGYCHTPPQCRAEGQTCDVNADCCNPFMCEGNRCVQKSCPADCNDRNSCTRDYCDYSTNFTCMNRPIIPCCGNGICEGPSENCAGCPDCNCNAANESCISEACVSTFDYEVGGMERQYNITTCENEIDRAWDARNYASAKARIEPCRQEASSYKNDVEELGRRVSLDGSQANHSGALINRLDALDRLWAYYGREIAITEKTDSGAEYKDAEKVGDLKGARAELEWAIYDLLLIMNERPGEWDGDDDAFLSRAKNLYNDNNQRINSLYDGICGSECKYAMQVDPMNPRVIEATDGLKRGISDQAEVEMKLLTYARNNVNYSYDPNWQTDWVQPPGYTLITRYGDCEDKSVLLASMFLQAGVEGVEVCSVDSDWDLEDDHETVAVYDGWARTFYEATWENETEPIPEGEYEGRWTCYNVLAIQEDALTPTCYDGTPYGECAEGGIDYCGSDGILISDCERCGCNAQWPYCITEGTDEGYCFRCGMNWNHYPDGTCCRPGWYQVGLQECCPEGTTESDGYCYD